MMMNLGLMPRLFLPISWLLFGHVVVATSDSSSYVIRGDDMVFRSAVVERGLSAFQHDRGSVPAAAPGNRTERFLLEGAGVSGSGGHINKKQEIEYTHGLEQHRFLSFDFEAHCDEYDASTSSAMISSREKRVKRMMMRGGGGVMGTQTVPRAKIEKRIKRQRARRRKRQMRKKALKRQRRSYRRGLFWSLWSLFDEFKTEASMWDTSTSRNGRVTLTKNHYVVVPTWWDGEPQTAFDIPSIVDVLNGVVQYYDKMSWGLQDITFEVWDAEVLPGVTRDNADFENADAAIRSIVINGGYVEFVDYTAIMMVYIPTNREPFDVEGGWAVVNSNLMQVSYPMDVAVTRHEMGHSYGHEHHLTNRYNWRFDRGSDEFAYDGWDIMSGGNEYAKSDLPAASKWYYNWITNDSVIMMQPEGKSASCPNCLSSINQAVLKPFDDVTVRPSSSNKMAIHIPILGTPNGKTYSYWLSYRGTGNDRLAAGGLSVHVSWFSLGGIYGASYDSLNYDAFGGSDESVLDSFVVPGTCYPIAPPALLMDLDYGAAEQVQPVACVDSVDKGKSITVSVSFLNPFNLPPVTVTLGSERKLECSKSGTSSGSLLLDVSSSKAHLLHFAGTGINGTVDVDLSLQSSIPSATATAFFYDTYPHAYMALDSPASYGAFKSVTVTTQGQAGALNYATEFGEAYILIVTEKMLTGTATFIFNSVCVVTQCHGSQYMGGDGRCKSCPAGSVSPVGSTKIAECVACGAGLVPSHKTSTECTTSNEMDPPITTAAAWRIRTPAFLTKEGWRWDVNEIRFYSSSGCSAASLVSTSMGTAIDSANAGDGYTPDNAFGPEEPWGGRPDEQDVFWIGMDFGSANVTVKCLIVDQTMETAAMEVTVQARKVGSAAWRNVWVASDLVGGENELRNE